MPPARVRRPCAGRSGPRPPVRARPHGRGDRRKPAPSGGCPTVLRALLSSPG
jgi:hypothetical protein